jgi:DNA-binding ferritin-like protein
VNLIELFLTLQNQIKVYHWQTESFAEHEAFGKTYNTLDGLIDEFIEVYMGKNSRIKSKNKFTITLSNYDGDSKDMIKAFVDVLNEDLLKDISESDTDLINLRDEMLSALNKLNYLLTLK